MEVVPGVHQLKLWVPLRGHVNVYLIQGKNGFTLVDTGFETKDALTTIEKELGEHELNFKDISQVVVTHSHIDHCGLVRKLKQLSGAKLALHELEKMSLDTPQEVERFVRDAGVPEDFAQELTEGYSYFKKYLDLDLSLPEIVLRGGEVISTGVFDFRVIWTPGHSPGHICLYEPEKKILLAGDHILPITTPIIGFHHRVLENPLADYINSLEAMKKLEVSLVLPGHEHPFENFQERIGELLQHHARRKAEILEILGGKPKSAYEVATEITWMPHLGGVGWQSLDLMDKWLAMLETLAHLEALMIDEKVRKETRNEIGFYSLP